MTEKNMNINTAVDILNRAAHLNRLAHSVVLANVGFRNITQNKRARNIVRLNNCFHSTVKLIYKLQVAAINAESMYHGENASLLNDITNGAIRYYEKAREALIEAVIHYVNFDGEECLTYKRAREIDIDDYIQFIALEIA